MSEFDRYLISSTFDPVARRVKRELSASDILSARGADTRRDLLRKRLFQISRSLFNEDMPLERMARLSGMPVPYWRRFYRNPSRTGMRHFLTALRAHISGLRDHLAELDADLVDLGRLQASGDLFASPGRRRAQR